MNRPFVTVGVDGSVYRFHPTFKDLLDSKIDELVDGKLEVGKGMAIREVRVEGVGHFCSFSVHFGAE